MGDFRSKHVSAMRSAIAVSLALALLALLPPSAGALGGGQVGTGFGTNGTGNGQFFNPGTFGADPVDGTLYTGDYVGASSDAEATNFRIQQLSPSGEFKASAEIKRYFETGKIASLNGIAVDHGAGKIYLTESCRVAKTGGTFTCIKFGGKFAARKILVFSTTPEGTVLKQLPSIALPSGENELYEVKALAVDPGNHEIEILAEENLGNTVLQRVTSAGVLGPRFVDTSGSLKPEAGQAQANSLVISPAGVSYTLTGHKAPGYLNTRLWRLPQSLSSLEAVAAFGGAAEKERWSSGREARIEGFLDAQQAALDPAGDILYFKEFRTESEEKNPGNLSVRAYSLSANQTVGVWGGGSSSCKISTSSAGLAALPGGNLGVFDFGNPVAKPTEKPAYGGKVLSFGPGGSGCAEPIARFTINGKPSGEEPSGLKAGEKVKFDATTSDLAQSFAKEVIWKWGDGTESSFSQAEAGKSAGLTAEHAYAANGKYTVKLQIVLENAFYGEPATVARTLTVGTVVTKQKLTATKEGTGSGTIASSPAGIDCGATCAAEFITGEEVTLTATPAEGSTFAGWSGACSGTGSCTVTMSAAREVGAKFNLQSFQLKVSRAGSGSGAVTSSPVGIACGSQCEAAYLFGSEVTLTATPAEGSTFAGWSGACSGTGSCTVTMSAAREVTAEFVLSGGSSYSLKVTKSGIGSAPITSTPKGIDCRSTCQASFPSGTKVTLKAEPLAGTKPAVWTGCDKVNGANECELTLSSNREANAYLNGIQCTGSNLTAAGSTLQAPAQTGVWAPGFHKSICPSSPLVAYEGIGSGAGLREWNADGARGSLNTGLAFIGTDQAPSKTQIESIKSKAGGAEVAVIPVAQTTIAILANPPAGCEIDSITNSNLAGAMEGRIREWSKLETAEGAGCNAPITRVVRKDESGTTSALKAYLYRLYAKGLSCTVGATEGKASWRELANVAWPETCGEKALSAVVRATANGGTAEVEKVNSTSGAIGYAALPEAKAGVKGATEILALQNNGQKKAAEAKFADPAAGTQANCAAMTYQVPTPLGGRRDVDWSGVFGGRPAIGAGNYPLCALTYDLALHGYGLAGFSEAQAITVRDYLYGYVVQDAGQSAIAGGYYAPLPGSAEAQTDVLGAARNAASGISY
jgi:ABC-type phosphate transport system substrate-binding protein